MRRITLLLVCILAGLPGAAQLAETAHATEESGFVIVQYRTGNALAQTAEAQTFRDEGFRSLPVPDGMTTQEFISQLRQDPLVLDAYPDAVVTAAEAPNDPYYASNQASYMNLIRAAAAWDLETGSKHPVTVAVLDSGLDINHPEFQGRLWENANDADNDGVDDDGNGCVDDRNGCRFVDLTSENRDGCGYTSSTPNGNIRDDNGKPGNDNQSHGTIVSGIIGAAGNNGIGIAGIDWNVRLMVVKVLDCGVGGRLPKGSMANVAEGIRYATRNGAQIISLSLASAPGDQAADIPNLRRAIEEANDRGVLIVTAAGNHTPGASQVGPGYPGAYTQYPNLITVGASNDRGEWATFSNYGPALDIAAPGVNIASTTRTDLGFAVPYGTSAEGGTSFSTPIVAGVLALMVARNPQLTLADYVTLLKSTATPPIEAPHGQNWAGAGIVNAGRAVASVPMTITGVALQDFKDVPNGTELRAFVSGQDCGSTTSTTFGQQARFSLRVRADGEQAGCGAPGRDVFFSVGGLPVSASLPWPGPDETLSLPNHDLGTVSPPPGPVVIQSLNGTWSNIAVLDSGGALPAGLASLSTPWTAVVRWDPAKSGLSGTGGYRVFTPDTPEYAADLTHLERYDAVWVLGDPATIATANPNPPAGRQIALAKGWNNIVWTGSNRAVQDALKDITGKYTQVLHYENTTSTWRFFAPDKPRYVNDFGGLFKLQTYWIYMTEAGTVTMD